MSESPSGVRIKKRTLVFIETTPRKWACKLIMSASDSASIVLLLPDEIIVLGPHHRRSLVTLLTQLLWWELLCCALRLGRGQSKIDPTTDPSYTELGKRSLTPSHRTF